LRVITGTAKGKKLKTPLNDEIRPASDSVKEAIFCAIQFEIYDAVVLDLFAGTGQLGIEALSRGAKKAYFTDNSQQAVKLINENLRITNLQEKAEVANVPFGTFLKKSNAIFDIVFLDPPYETGLLAKALTSLENKLSESAVIVCKHEIELKLPLTASGLIKTKTLKHGKTGITFYRVPPKEKESDI
jgi:16S rRNA (guanine966-N2)-methyltransferase